MERPAGASRLSPPARICLCVSVVVGIILVAAAGGVRAEQARFTPVYQNVTCIPTAINLGGVVLTPLGFDLDIDVECTNPNPYALEVSPASVPGIVALRNPQTHVAVVSAKEKSIEAADGDQAAVTTLVLTASIKLDFVSTLTLGGNLLGGAFRVYFELKMQVLVQPVMMLFFSPLTMELPVDEKCGMEVQLVGSARVGSATCSGDFAELRVPSIDDPSAETLGFTAKVNEQTLQEANEGRDRICAPAFMVGLSLGLVLLLLPIAACAVLALRARRQPGGKGGGNTVEPIRIGAPQ